MNGRFIEFRGEEIWFDASVSDDQVIETLSRYTQKGERGEQGPAGETGPRGERGESITGARGEVGPVGPPGPAGPAGKDGRDGRDGKDGAPGRPGADGADGADGKDGVGIESVRQTSADRMVVALTDGRQILIDLPKGPAGRDGRDGRDGSPGRVVRQEIAVSGGGGGASAEVDLNAAASIIAFKAITTNAAGEAVYADAGTAEHVDQVVGVAKNASAAGGRVTVVGAGPLENSGWNWLTQKPVFLGLNGDLTQTPGAGVFHLQLGYAKSATEIYLRIGRGVLRA